MNCTLCARRCGADRAAGKLGFCGAPAEMTVAKIMLHPWEEPCFGDKAGAVFFAGCSLGCLYCQNKTVSAARPLRGMRLSPHELSLFMTDLQARGASCIDLVTPTHFADSVLEALRLVRGEIQIPVVWNTGGYDSPETVRACAGLVDVFLTDFKYGTAALAEAYSLAPDYPEAAAAALAEMFALTGAPVYDGDRLVRGTVIRHLVLPGGRKDSAAALARIAETVPPDKVLLSLMRQYTPDFAPASVPALRRRVTTFEYESVRKEALRLGFECGFSQEKDSASAQYTPDWEEGEGGRR